MGKSGKCPIYTYFKPINVLRREDFYSFLTRPVVDLYIALPKYKSFLNCLGFLRAMRLIGDKGSLPNLAI